MSQEDRWRHKWAVPSSSNDGYYTVAEAWDGSGSRQDGNGEGPGLACSCVGWTRHMPRTDCKHCREVRALIFGQASSAQTMEEAILNRMLGRAIGVLK